MINVFGHKVDEVYEYRDLLDSKALALYAAKRRIDPEKEKALIKKAETTKCRCHHFTGTDPCLYRSCRHSYHVHWRGNERL
jgi:hypothetical protein